MKSLFGKAHSVLLNLTRLRLHFSWTAFKSLPNLSESLIGSLGGENEGAYINTRGYSIVLYSVFLSLTLCKYSLGNFSFNFVKKVNRCRKLMEICWKTDRKKCYMTRSKMPLWLLLSITNLYKTISIVNNHLTF